jgi:zinc protease
MRRPYLACLAVLVTLACAGPRATQGLLEGDLPLSTLAKEGDLGYGRFNFPVRELSRPSGLRVACETTPSRGMVAVVVAFDVGSTADPAGREGLAHYTEHLVFRGRPRAVELSSELARLGAVYNAETTLDRTTFHAMAPATALPALLDIAARLLGDPLAGVEPRMAAIELDVVRSELLLKNETGVYGQMRGWMQSMLVPPAHPYRRPTGGSLESLQRLTLADAREFAATHYKPARATLLVVGEVEGERLSSLMKERFPAALLGDPARPVSREVGPVPLLNITIPAAPATPPRHQAAVARPELWLGYLMPGKFSQNAGNTLLVTSPATGNLLREYMMKDPDVVGVDVIALHERLATILAIQVVLASDKRRDEISQDLRAFVGQLWRPAHPRFAQMLASAAPVIPIRVGNRYVAVKPTAQFFMQRKNDELLRLRLSGIAHAVNGLESWQRRALDRAEYLQTMGAAGSLVWAVAQATSTEEASVAEFATQFLATDRGRVTYIDPLPANRLPRPGAVGVADRTTIADDGSAAVVFEDPFLAPAPAELAGTRQVRLPNGLTVLLARRTGFPGLTALLGFAGGAAVSEPMGALQLLRRIEHNVGVSMPLNALEVVPVDGPTFTADAVRAGPRNLANVLYLLAQRIVLTDGTDWGSLLDGEETATIKRFQVSPKEKADYLIRRALYGSHPLAQPPAGPDTPAISGQHMERWIPRMRSPRNALLAVVGDFDLDEGERLARAWFGPWKGVAEAVPPTLPPAPVPLAGKGIAADPLIVDQDAESQSHLMLACRLPRPQPGVRASHDLLASILGSYLNTMVRQRAGAAYSVTSQATLRGGDAADLRITLELENTRLPEALAAVRALWARLGRDGFDPGALSQMRWGLTHEHNLGYDTSGEVAFRLLESWSLGWPMTSLAQYPASLRAATPADLRAAFSTCQGSTVSLVLGDEAAVKAAFAGPPSAR